MVDNPAADAYAQLKKRFYELDNLSGMGGILQKDSETFMAPGSADDRSQQLQTLASVSHRLITDPAMKNWLDAAEAGRAALPADDQRNLHLMRRQWAELNALSAELAQELARISSEGQTLHTKWKPSGNWAVMKDWYAQAFNAARSAGEAKIKALPGFASVYEAMLDSYSPGMREATIAREFARLEQALPDLIRAARDRQAAAPPPMPLSGPFPRVQQAELCHRIVAAVGFDFNRGRLDICDAHPSSGGTADDSRITAQIDEDNFLPALYAAVHEAGHAMYDQNRPLAWRYQPAGSHLGMGVHESQSRIIEVQACHTPEFFQYLEREARAIFQRPDDPALTAANLERLVNRMEPSFIRIHADEMTYPAHVILRHKLEKSLVDGTLSIDDLPQAWNDGMQKLLGITPPDPSQGHMQDVHWPTGTIGYFPAYTIGDMGAAQFFNAACRARPETLPAIAQGDFQPLHTWLNDNVRSKAALVTPEELFRGATGEDLNAHYYLDHLSRRFVGQPYRADSPAP